MKIFEMPAIEVEVFAVEDVITTSIDNLDPPDCANQLPLG